MSDLEFHSKNIADTKAKEKREIFVKVEEKKTIKQSAEEFQKKFAEAKAHAAESRARIENPGADEHGVIRSRQRFNINWRKVLKIFIPLVIIAGLALAVYLNWGAIHHEFFEVSRERAAELVRSNPGRAISMYDELIKQTTNEDSKIDLLYERMGLLSGYHADDYADQILADAYAAYEILPCYETASVIVETEENYGSTITAEEWRAKLETLEREGLILGNG